MLSMRQVFGLASLVLPTVHASQPVKVSAVVEVILAYRCGAVPVFHRVPFSANIENALEVSTSMDMVR